MRLGKGGEEEVEVEVVFESALKVKIRKDFPVEVQFCDEEEITLLCKGMRLKIGNDAESIQAIKLSKTVQ